MYTCFPPLIINLLLYLTALPEIAALFVICAIITFGFGWIFFAQYVDVTMVCYGLPRVLRVLTMLIAGVCGWRYHE